MFHAFKTFGIFQHLNEFHILISGEIPTKISMYILKHTRQIPIPKNFDVI